MLRYAFLILVAVSLPGCEAPPQGAGTASESASGKTPFTNQVFTDPALAECVRVHMLERAIHYLEDLPFLACPRRGIADLQGVHRLTGLKTLYIDSNAISNIEPLAQLPNLAKLKIANNPVRDAGPLGQLDNLWYLAANGLAAVVDLEKLKGLQKLRSLWLWDNQLQNHEVLGQFPALQELAISNTGTGNLSFVAGMQNAAGIKKIWLSNNNISDISSLRHLRNIETLQLDGNAVTDLSPLSGLEHLRYLNIASNRGLKDITPIFNMPGLEMVELAGNDGISCAQVAGLRKRLPAARIHGPAGCESDAASD